MSKTDAHIKQALIELDQRPDIECTPFECDFIESVAFKWKGDYTEKQRQTARNILSKYKIEIEGDNGR